MKNLIKTRSDFRILTLVHKKSKIKIISNGLESSFFISLNSTSVFKIQSSLMSVLVSNSELFLECDDILSPQKNRFQVSLTDLAKQCNQWKNIKMMPKKVSPFECTGSPRSSLKRGDKRWNVSNFVTEKWEMKEKTSLWKDVEAPVSRSVIFEFHIISKFYYSRIFVFSFYCSSEWDWYFCFDFSTTFFFQAFLIHEEKLFYFIFFLVHRSHFGVTFASNLLKQFQFWQHNIQNDCEKYSGIYQKIRNEEGGVLCFAEFQNGIFSPLLIRIILFWKIIFSESKVCSRVRMFLANTSKFQFICILEISGENGKKLVKF